MRDPRQRPGRRDPISSHFETAVTNLARHRLRPTVAILPWRSLTVLFGIRWLQWLQKDFGFLDGAEPKRSGEGLQSLCLVVRFHPAPPPFILLIIRMHTKASYAIHYQYRLLTRLIDEFPRKSWR
jgi:hypothetical protein